MTNLDELEALYAAAPTPWWVSYESGTIYNANGNAPGNERIVAICNAFPALLRELRAARKVVELARPVSELVKGDTTDDLLDAFSQLRTRRRLIDAAIREYDAATKGDT